MIIHFLRNSRTIVSQPWKGAQINVILSKTQFRTSINGNSNLSFKKLKSKLLQKPKMIKLVSRKKWPMKLKYGNEFCHLQTICYYQLFFFTWCFTFYYFYVVLIIMWGIYATKFCIGEITRYVHIIIPVYI